MNATTCATSENTAAWKQVNWQKAEVYVKKLQNRIVKAQQESRHGKVKSL